MVGFLRWRLPYVVLALASLAAACTSGGTEPEHSSPPGSSGSTVGSVPGPNGTVPQGTSLLPAIARPDGSIVWAALGDSYSAGVGGVDGNDDTGCGNRSITESYAFQTPYRIAAAGSPVIGELRFVACGGATAELENGTAPNGHPVPDGALNTVRWNQVAAAEGADIVTVTAGGNDADFSDYAQECFVPERWRELYDEKIPLLRRLGLVIDYVGKPEGLPGRIVDDLSKHRCRSHDLDADPLSLERREDEPAADWLALRSRLVALYLAIAAVAPNAHVYVMTYPVPFAPEEGFDDKYDDPNRAVASITKLSKDAFDLLGKDHETTSQDKAENLMRNMVCALSRTVPFLQDEMYLANAFATRLNDEITAAAGEARAALPADSHASIHLVTWARPGPDGQPVEAPVRWYKGPASGALTPVSLDPDGAPEVVARVRKDNPDAHRVAFNPFGLCATGDVMTHFFLLWERNDSAHPTTYGYEVATDVLDRTIRADHPIGNDAGTRTPLAAWFSPDLEPEPDLWAEEERRGTVACAMLPPPPPTPGIGDPRCRPQQPPAGAPNS